MMSTSMSPAAGLSTPRGLSLAQLSEQLGAFDPSLRGSAATPVTGVQQDSRKVQPGDLFVAREGASADGTHFVAEAVGRGASAVLVEADAGEPSLEVPLLRVRNVRRAASFAAEAVYGFPSRALRVVGITGTNGKTTVSFLVEHALQQLGARPARLGTLGFAFEGVELDSPLTTPEADAIARSMASVRDLGGTHFVMEVSSIALELERVSAVHFAVAALTNLTQDHLDFHGSMERYAAAKSRLFRELAPEVSVLDIDRALGRELSLAVTPVISVGRDGSAALHVAAARLDAAGVHAELRHAGLSLSFQSRLVGAHNLENLVLAAGVLLGLGYAPGEALAALAQAPAVPGRLERCDEEGDDVLVVVDYAHTPDALERVLAALRPLTRNELCCVFGCGGDRDPQKRPKMAEAVARGADFAFVTNDNPRSEDPAKIAEAILPPLRASGTPHVVELDRALAIERAVLQAKPGDAVLLAGKGHETYQIFGVERVPFDDRTHARAALRRRRARSGG